MLVTTDVFASLGMNHWHCNLRKIEARGGRFCFELCQSTYIREFAQTHLVRKCMASCGIKILLRSPPSTGTKHMCGMQVGAGTTFGLARTTFGLPVHGDHRGAIIGVGGGLGIR